jgi:hypothetical protein
MASDPVLNRPQMIAFCEREARVACGAWPAQDHEQAAKFLAIAQALQEDTRIRLEAVTQERDQLLEQLTGKASDAAIVPRLRQLWLQLRHALDPVPFNERKQEFFCRACRYHDPLGDAGGKLHDDDCPLRAFEKVLLEELAARVREGA